MSGEEVYHDSDANAGDSGISTLQLLSDGPGQFNYTVYILSQQAADRTINVTQLDSSGSTIQQWQGIGRGGISVPFHGWALYVEEQHNMYFSERGVDAVSSPYGRVVKLAPNGTELGQWTMNDGVAYQFTGVVYDDSTASGGSCAFWMSETDKGVFRVAADGVVLQQPYAPPVDPADNRTAQFISMTLDDESMWADHPNSSLILLDASNPSTTKVWRFSLDNHTYTLLNTSGAMLSPNITSVAINPFTKNIESPRQ